MFFSIYMEHAAMKKLAKLLPSLGCITLARICLVLVLLSCRISFAHDNTLKHVLILNSYHSGLEWTDKQVKAATEFLSQNEPDIELYIEYMDTKRIFSRDYLNKLYHLYLAKYSGVDFDAIITTDDNALQFVYDYHSSELFKEAPVVFSGINDYDESFLEHHPHSTGVIEVLDIEPTIELALKLQPDVKRIYVVADDTPTGLGQMKNVQTAAKQFDNLTFEYVRGKDYSNEELGKKLRSIPEHSIVLLTVWLRDRNGEYISPNEGGELVSSNATVPVYGIIDMFLGRGIVGGKLLNSDTHGRIAAEIALRIINGEDPSNIPIVATSTNPWMFDFEQLERWDLSPSLLPESSVIINEPYKFYDEYRGLIWSVISALLVLSTIVVILMINIKYRKKAEMRFKEGEERLLLATQAGSIGVWDWDVVSNELVWDKSMYCLYGISRDNFAGAYEAWISCLHPEDTNRVNAAIQGALNGEKEYVAEFRIIRPDGSVLYIKADSKTFRDEDGKPLRMIGTNIDITELKLIGKKLRESEEKLDSIIRNISDIVYRLDHEGKITFINDGIRQYGYSTDELIGSDILDLVCPCDRDKALYRLNERRSGDRSTKSFEIRLRRKKSDLSGF